MASAADTLPPGFTLDPVPSADPGGAGAALPAGFTLDSPPPGAASAVPFGGSPRPSLPLALTDTPANAPAPASAAPALPDPVPATSPGVPTGADGQQPAGPGTTVRPLITPSTGTFLPGVRVPGQGPIGADLNAAGQGLAAGIGSAISGLGTAAGHGLNVNQQTQLDAIRRIDAGETVPAADDVADYAHMNPDEQAALKQQLQVPTGQRPGDALISGAQGIGNQLTQGAQTQLPVDSRQEGFGTGLARGIGGLAPIVAAGLTPAGAAMVPLVIGAQGFDSTFREAKANGATDDDAFQVAATNGAVQAGLMSVPLSGAILHVADPLLRDGLLKTAINYGAHGLGFETAAEAGKFVDNYLARSTYDPNRKLTQGLGDQVGENLALSLVVPAAYGLPSLYRAAMQPKIDAAMPVRLGVAGMTEAAQQLQQPDVSGSQPQAGDPQGLTPSPPPVAMPAAAPDAAAGTPDASAGAPVTPADASGTPADQQEGLQADPATGLPPGFTLDTGAAAPVPAAPDPSQLPPGFTLDQPATAAAASLRSSASSATSFMDGMRQGESRGNDNAKNPVSSASGRYQFLDRTFLDFLRSGANTGHWTMADKNDPDVQEAAMRWLAASNADSLRSGLGRDPTSGELAAAHLVGAGGARALIQGGNQSAEEALAGAVGPAKAHAMVAANGKLLQGSAQDALGAISSYYMGGRGSTPVAPIAGKTVGDPLPVFTNGGSKIEVQPMLVDLSSLITSHDDDGRINPAFGDNGLQPRDRSSAASQSQVQELAAGLTPERLAPSTEASTGAPIVDSQGVVESGNGRTMALRRIYTDPQLSAQRDAYTSWLQGQGFDTTGLKEPVLVSQRLTPLDQGQLQQFTRDANERSTLGMNAAEQARADSARVGQSIDLWQGNDVSAAANAPFVRDVMAQMSPEERGSMMLPDGTLSAAGERRIQGAVTAHAYGDTSDGPSMGPTLERFLNGDDAGTKAVAGALSDAAGPWAQMRGMAARGEIPPGLDITPDLATAVQTIARARQLGRPVSELVAQTDLDRPPMSDAATTLLSGMFRNDQLKQAAGRDKVAAMLRDYATEAMRQTPGQDMFGAPPPSAKQVLEATRRAPDGSASKARMLSVRDRQLSVRHAADAPDARTAPPEAQVARQRLYDGAQALMRYMGLPPEVGLKFVDRLVDAATGKAADGMYQRKLVTFALDTDPHDIPFRMFHEIVHGLMDPELGLLTKPQRDTLLRGADRWLARRTGHGSETNRNVLARSYGVDPQSDQGKALLREEAVARMGESALQDGLIAHGTAGWVYRRMTNFVGGVGNLLRGRGFRTADDVFRGLLQGRKASDASRQALLAAGPQDRTAALLAGAGVPPSMLEQQGPWRSPDAGAPVPEHGSAPPEAPAAANLQPGDANIANMQGGAAPSRISRQIADLTAAPDRYFSLRSQTESPAFRRWFGESKVVDGSGQPRVMYHGTSANEEGDAFSSFDTYGSQYGLMGLGSYFTADPLVASLYTAKGRGTTPTVYPVFLSVKHPIDMDAAADATAWRLAFPGVEEYHEGGTTNESWYRAAEERIADEQLPKWEGAEVMQDGLRAMGHDGITHTGGGRFGKDDGIRHRVLIAFEPEQIKSAIGNNGAFDPKNVRIAFSLRDAPEAARFAQKAADLPGFYSAVARTAALLKQEKGSGEQFAAAIRNAAGVKPEELKWLGLDKWLQGRPKVSRDEVLDYIAANNLGLREVSNGYDPNFPDPDKHDFSAMDAAEDRLRQALGAELGLDPDSQEVGYQMSVLDPAELDQHSEGVRAAWADREREEQTFARVEAAATADREAARFSEYQLPAGAKYREVLLTLPEKEPSPPSVTANIDELRNGKFRVSAPGLQASLHGTYQEALEEAASIDRQFNRAPDRNNFKSPHWPEPNVVAHLRLNDRIDPTDGKRVLFVEEVQSDWHQAGRKSGYQGDPDASSDAVPDAPFRTTWPALAMKRALRMAAEDGYDRVAWTTGNTQAERYDLKGGDGDGMRAFYDRMLPAEVGKIVRPFGGAVARGSIALDDTDRPGTPPTTAVHQVEMTPQLRSAALEDGFPLFSLRDRGTALVKSAQERRDVFNDAMRRSLVPITVGAKEAQNAAARFANAIADVSWRYGQMDRLIQRRFGHAERTLMWNALDEQSLFEITLKEAMQEALPLEQPRIEAEARAAFKGRGMEALNPEQREVVEQLNQLAQQTWVRMQQRGLVNASADGLPYYSPRFFVLKANDKAAVVPGREGGGSITAIDPLGLNLTTRKPLTRELRYTEDAIRAMKAMFGPDTDLVRDIRTVGVALSKEERAIAGVDLIRSIKDYTAKTGTSVITAQPPTWEEADYVEINHPSLKELVPATRQLDDGTVEVIRDGLGNPVMTRRLMQVHKDFEHPLRAVLTEPQGDLYKAAMKLKGAATGLIMFSPFMHLGVELGRALPALPGTVLTMRWLRDGRGLRADRVFMSDAIRNGLRMVGGSWMQDITGIYDAPHVLPGRSWLAQALGRMGDLKDKQFGNDIREAVDRLGDFWHQGLLWDRVADLQVAIYRDMRDKYVAGGFDSKTASIMAAHLANRYAGAMPKEALSNAANKAANLAMFSRSFTLGNLGVMKDMLNGMPAYVRVQVEQHAGADVAQRAKVALRNKARAAFVMDVGLFYLSNALAQNAFQLVAGQSLDQVAGGYVRRAVAELQHIAHRPQDLLWPFGVAESLLPQSENEPGKQDRVWMGNRADGTAVYGRLPLGKVGEEFTGWLGTPMTMLRNKTSTLIRPTWEAITNRDSLGKPIRDDTAEGVNGMLQNAGRTVMHIVGAQAPFGALEAVGTIARELPGAITGSNTPLNDKDLSDAAMQLLPSFMPPPLNMQISHGYPGGPEAGVEAAAQREQQFQRAQVMPEARRLIAAGDIEGARTLLQGAGLPPQQILGVIRSAVNPARGQVRMQRGFQRSATPEQQSQLQNVTGGKANAAAAAPDTVDQAADAGIAQAQQMARQAGR